MESPWRHVKTGLALVALVGQGCSAPRIAGPAIERPDPRAEDPYAGTGLGTRDLLEATDFVVAALSQRLGPPPEGRRWRVRVDRIDNDTSLDLHGAVICDRVVALASQRASQVTLFVQRGEELGQGIKLDQAGGVRAGESPAPGLLVPDYQLFGVLREHAIHSSQGLSRFVQFSFSLTDLTGAVVWSDVYDVKKAEARHAAYR